MTLKQLSDTMIFHLGNLSRKKKQVTEDTVHSEVLSSTDGFGASNSKNIYRASVRWTLKYAKKQDKPWPRNWMELSVKDLASKLLIFLVLLCSTAQAQLTMDLNTIKTSNKENAIQIGITYVKSLDSLFQVQDLLMARNNSLFALTPEFSVKTGTSDAFSSITAKATGMWMFFQRAEVSGYITPNTAKMFHTVPLSIGVETNNTFSILNTIAEIGYVPWYQTGNVPDWLRHTKVGVFLQGGYKSSWDSAGVVAVGGQKDESLEVPNSALLRAKGSVAAEINTPVQISGARVGITGAADLWYDIANGATYYKYDATLRFHLTDSKFIDLVYQRGSGAPLFNSGDQYGIGLSITF